MTTVNRRAFIESLGAASALTIVPRRVLGGPGFVPPSDQILLAQIGCGTQAQRQVNIGLVARPDLQFLAVVDPNGPRSLKRWLSPASPCACPISGCCGMRSRWRSRTRRRPTHTSGARSTARGGTRSSGEARAVSAAQPIGGYCVPAGRSGVNEAATWANNGLYFSTAAAGAIQISRYIVVPLGNEYWTT
jgi:hypothetical protein